MNQTTCHPRYRHCNNLEENVQISSEAFLILTFMNENSTSITKDNRITIVGTKRSMFQQCIGSSFFYLPLSKQIEQIFVSATNYNQSINQGERERERRSTYWFRWCFFRGHLDLICKERRKRRFQTELARAVFVLIAKKKKEKRDIKYIRERKNTRTRICV